MNSDRRAIELFEQALDLSPELAREFLDRECGDDRELRSAVEDLLEAHRDPEGLFGEATAEVRLNGDLDSPAERANPSPSSDSSHHGRFLPGTKIAGRYRVVLLAGRGGMGEVFRADDLKLGHTVALKFLPREIAGDPRRLELFHSEVRLTRQISHPNVCRIYDIGEIGDEHFLSMEFVDGEDLKALLRRIGRLPPDKGVEISQELCAGLAAAHDQGVIHRDLKPANIMIDGSGRVRITDFGLARTIDDGRGAEIAGTPAYMAPEQLSDGTTNVRSDIYSLGLILHELFTGESVYKTGSPVELRRLHEDSRRISSSSAAGPLDPRIARAIEWCLEKDPANRPASAREVAAALPGGEPLAAALAAGETPSPGMVAAAGGRGGLEIRRATLLVAAALTGIALVWLSSGASVVNRSQLETHPQILVDRAREIVELFGYAEAPVDSKWRLVLDPRRVARPDPSGETAAEAEARREARQRRVSFWYRESPRVMVPRSIRTRSKRNLGHVTFRDPPIDLPGMVRLRLDASGHLLSFEGSPPPDPSNSAEAPVPRSSIEDLRDALELTFELAPDSAVETEPLVTPAVPFDARARWHAVTTIGTPVAIEVASFRGRIVRYQVSRREPPSAFSTSAPNLFFVIYLSLLVGSAFLAWFHLATGRGDRVGARRIAQFMFCGLFMAFVFVGEHSSDLSAVVGQIQGGVALSLFGAFEIWLFYLAIEPFVRRLWPHNLISWYRILEGRFRDRLVGQSVLYGTVAAILVRLLDVLQTYTSDALGEIPSVSYAVSTWPLHGTAYSLARTTVNLVLAVQFGFSYLLSFVVLKFIARKPILAALAFVVVWASALSRIGGWGAVDAVFLTSVVVVHAFVLMRFGLTSLIVTLFVERMLHWPITLDASSWYFSTGVVGTAFVVAIALSSGWTSVGGGRGLAQGSATS